MHKQKSSKSLDLAHPNLLPSGSQSEVLQAIIGYSPNVVLRIFWARIWDLFLDHYRNSAGWDPFWAKELVILPAYGVHLGKLRRLEKENSSLRTWVWRLGKVSMAGQPPQPLLPLEIKAL